MSGVSGKLIVSRDALTVDEAVHEAGVGKAQMILLIITGLTFASDAAELTFLSFVTVVLKCDWGLTSTQESLIGSAVFGGMITGAPCWGYITDHVGRRPSFLLSSSVIGVFGFITAFTQGFYQLVLVRAAVGFGVSGLTVGFDIFAEALPGADRGRFLLLFQSFWTLGCIYVTLCAWLVLESRGWQFFTVLAALPALVSAAFACCLLPESPHWLVAEGREEEALVIVNEWVRMNGHRSKPIETIVPHEQEEQGNPLELVTSLMSKRSFSLMAVVWFAGGMSYFGIVMLLPRLFQKEHPQDQAAAEGNSCKVSFDFHDLGISCTAEILGVVFPAFLIDRAGRARTQGSLYTLGGVAAFMLGFSSLNKVVLTVFAAIARVGAMGSFSSTWVHTAELFPTKLRGVAHGPLNMMARSGAFLAPFLISDMFSPWQRAAIMGGVSITGGVAALCLPETAGKDLSFALQDSEDDGESSGQSESE